MQTAVLRRNHEATSTFGRGGSNAVLAGHGRTTKPATDVPGPGAYGTPPQPGLRAAPAFSMGLARAEPPKTTRPGPAAYQTAGISAAARPEPSGFGFGTASQRQLSTGEVRTSIDPASVNAAPADGVTEARRRLQRLLAVELAQAI